MTRPDSRGPGFRRMQRNAGPDALEALRQDTLAMQRRALHEAATEHAVEPRDREFYRDYPAPRGPKKRGKK